MKKVVTIFLTFLSCLGENSWEDLESDYDHVLNVFGLISLDTSQRSYVGLYSTTDLGDTSQIYLGTDTIGWCNCDEEECSWSEQCDTEEIEGYWIIDSLFEPAALVKNASVTVTDDNGNAHQFSFIESVIALDAGYSVSSINDVNNFRLNLYIDTSGTFYHNGEVMKGQFQNLITANGIRTVSYNQNQVDNLAGGRYVNSQNYEAYDVAIIKLYNRTLSEEEVKGNFNAHRGRFGI